MSVDIDLTYLPIAQRRQSLREIETARKRIAGRVRERDSSITVQESAPGTQEEITKLVLRTKDRVQIKIEVSPVLRGTVYPPEIRSVCARPE